ncbi:hypothetical protein BpHYR1_033609 [Brachionus plicatilis]|uniref:Uncharacterized protein n=1 Tax=Brachionus plicatilis TaxID=10195 RepID=A0A3M7SMG6_BRAPC|nr:hypothetical protein BpHYR1_033609 [Brachionus plicatilis]
MLVVLPYVDLMTLPPGQCISRILRRLPVWRVFRLFLSDAHIPQHSLPYINVAFTTVLYSLSFVSLYYNQVTILKTGQF